MIIQAVHNDAAERLCHILASLNYGDQRQPIDPNKAFFEPNFDLVCDILYWFSCIVKPDAKVKDFSNRPRRYHQLHEQAQVSFLCEAGKMFARELGVHLDLLSLYRADNGSCIELLKIAELIYEAATLVSKENGIVTSGVTENPTERLSTALARAQEQLNSTFASLEAQLKPAVALVGVALGSGSGALASIQKAENLCEELENLLANECDLNQTRSKVLNEPLDLSELERVLLYAERDIELKMDKLQESNLELEKDLQKLNERIASKEEELVDAKQRLNDSLPRAPAYLSRYEKLRGAYEKCYAEYVSKFRNIMYLKSCVYSTGLGDDDECDADSDTDVAGVSGVVEDVPGESVELVTGGGGVRRMTLGLEPAANMLRLGSSKPMSES